MNYQFLHSLFEVWLTDTKGNLKIGDSCGTIIHATARLLLADRVPEISTCNIDMIPATSQDRIMDLLMSKRLATRQNNEDSNIYIATNMVNGYQSHPYFEKQNLEAAHEVSLDDVAERIQEKTGATQVTVLSNTEDKYTFIFAVCSTSMFDKTFFDLTISAFIKRLAPWYFEKTLTTAEKDFLASLLSQSQVNIRKAYDELWKEKKDVIRSAIYHIRLKDFNNQLINIQTDALQRKINEIQDMITSTYEDIKRYTKNLRDTNMRIAGAKTMLKNTDTDEVYRFFMDHPNFNLERFDQYSGVMRVTVVQPFRGFDEDVAETMVDEEDGLLYYYGERYSEQFQHFYNKIFFDEDYDLMMNATYEINFMDCDISCCAYNNSDSTYPNPHIYHYSCLGDYKRMFIDYIGNFDVIGVLSTCAASCESINIAEDPTMQHFVEDILDTYIDCPCVRVKRLDGQYMYVTPREVMEEVE